MKNIEQVQAFFHSHIENILDAQTAATWCEDEQMQYDVMALETDIAFFESEQQDDENYDESNFDSQHADTLSEAKELVMELNAKLAEKWLFEYPFIQLSNAVPVHAKDSALTLGWDLAYYIKLEFGDIRVECATLAEEISIDIDDKLTGRKSTQLDDDFDLFEYIDQQRVLFHLTKPS